MQALKKSANRKREKVPLKEKGWRDSFRLIQAHNSGEGLFWLYSRCVHQQQESMASVAKGNRLKYASLPPAHARVNVVAQGDGFQH